MSLGFGLMLAFQVVLAVFLVLTLLLVSLLGGWGHLFLKDFNRDGRVTEGF